VWPLIKWEPFEKKECFVGFPYYLNWDLAINMYHENNNIIVKMHVPDINPDRLDISIEGSVLRIDGSRQM